MGHIWKHLLGEIYVFMSNTISSLSVGCWIPEHTSAGWDQSILISTWTPKPLGLAFPELRKEVEVCVVSVCLLA